MEIEGFEIGERIGRGGMGSVFHARQLAASGRTVALKVIQPGLGEDDFFRTRFASEMEIAASLDHPNIVPVYEAKESEGQPYIAMALIKGEDLGSLIRNRGALDPDFTVGVISQIASALDAAHEEKIIHRDVKPGNILIDGRTDHAYLSDFGIAKSLEASRAETRTGKGLGSLHYTAPEQLEGKDPDQRSDVYALGCVLFQCLTGELPYKDGSEVFVLRQKLDQEPRRPREIEPSLDPAFDQVLDLALARDPDERFRSPGELADAAKAALSGEAPTRALRSNAGLAATTRLPGREDDRISPTRVQPRVTGKNPRFGTKMIGGAAVVLLIFAGLAIAQGDGDNSTATPGREPSSVNAGAESQQPESVQAPQPLALERVTTELLSAEVPSGWTTERIDERESGRYVSEWSDPDSPGTSVLIDAQTPGPLVGVAESAREVRASTSQSDGYSEIDFGVTTLAGRKAAEWVFDLPKVRKVDYFFSECNVGVAVLGAAPPTSFSEFLPTFRRVAASVEPECQPVSAESPISTEGIGPVLVGMTEPEAEKAGAFELISEGYVTGSCQYLSSPSVPEVGFMFNEGTLARIDAMNPDSATLSGIGIGDSEADVYSAYGDRIESEANYYDPENASYLTFVPEDSSDETRVLFDVREGQVVNIRAGRLPEVEYIEGCA